MTRLDDFTQAVEQRRRRPLSRPVPNSGPRAWLAGARRCVAWCEGTAYGSLGLGAGMAIFGIPWGGANLDATMLLTGLGMMTAALPWFWCGYLLEGVTTLAQADTGGG